MKGLNGIKKMLKNKGRDLARKSDDIVSSTAFVGRNVAVQKAPAAFGKLRQGINIEKKYLQAKVMSQMPYSVYVEFGTGRKVDMSDTPKDLLESAKKLKGKKNGTFDDFIERLTRWARLKGIPKEAVYPIAMSILEQGQEAQPFMRPAYKASEAYLRLKLAQL